MTTPRVPGSATSGESTTGVIDPGLLEELEAESSVDVGTSMWAVVFAATALLATPARRLAQRTMHGLDAWARERAQARAEARLWDLAKNDHRIMAELVQARARASEAQAANEAALAPLGLDNGVVLPLRRQSYLERLAAQYRHSQRLYYI